VVHTEIYVISPPVMRLTITGDAPPDRADEKE
jgi:hypothetical protein